MQTLLTTPWFLEHYAERLATELQVAAAPLTPLILPDGGDRLDDAVLESITVAFFHGDFRSDPSFTRRFFGACLRAPNLNWMQLPNSGVDDPVFPRLLAQGVRLTNAPGATAEPIAQTAIAGLLMLARGFPQWLAAQARRAWEPHAWVSAPADLHGQKLVIIGVGAIGARIAQLAKALGLHVIGIRRSSNLDVEGVDELRPVSALAQSLEEADWLALACPLSDETRGLIDATALRRLRPAARLINVSRGEVVDQTALIEALASGRLAGAYLDVFDPEPLPSDSPLWSLPNVIITPHDAAASAGNAHRVSELFLRNLGRWQRREALENEIRAST